MHSLLSRAVHAAAALLIATISLFGAPDRASADSVLVTTLHVFGDGSTAHDGTFPVGTLVFDAGTGDYYGATQSGGAAILSNSDTGGTVFRMTPAGVVTILRSFGDGTVPNDDGTSPFSGVIDIGGVFYGTCQNSVSGFGTIFSVTSAGVGNALRGTVPDPGPATPETALVAGGNGLIGTSSAGTSSVAKFFRGSVFTSDFSGNITMLHLFDDGTVPNDGQVPSCGLVSATGGFYGGTGAGGSAGQGVIYHLNGTTYTIDHNFGDGTVVDDGAVPVGLMVGSDGNIYGTTGAGGAFGKGTFFRMIGTSITILHSFGDPGTLDDGIGPVAPPVEDESDGSFYGTTRYGGSAGDGTLYRITVDGNDATATTLHSFGDGSVLHDGALPMCGLTQEGPGTFIGTTYQGGGLSVNAGTIFKFEFTSGSGGPGFPFLVSVTAAPPTVIGGGTSFGTVQLSAAVNQIGGVDVALSSSDPSAAVPATVHVPLGQSSAHFTITTTPVSAQVKPVIAATLGGVTRHQPMRIIPPWASHFVVTGPFLTFAGQGFSYTVTAQDANGNTVPSYAGVVHFSSSDPSAALPSDRTLTSGTGTFTGVLKTAGFFQTISANDRQLPALQGTSGSIIVIGRSTSHFMISAAAGATVGKATPFTVTAVDAYGNADAGYTGVAHFSSSDPAAGVPSNRPISGGVGSFIATFGTVGSQTITANDVALPVISGTSNAVAVASQGTSHFVVSAPASAKVGSPFTFTVTPEDASGNTLTTYRGVVHFTCTDGTASLPANGRFYGGSGTFTATLNAAGTQTLSVNDVQLPIVTGTSAAIGVSL